MGQVWITGQSSSTPTVAVEESHGGTQFDENKPDWSLLPWGALESSLPVWMDGAQKYTMDNWKKGISYSRMFSSIMRHLISWKLGEENDQESGHPHLAHVLVRVLMLLHYEQNGFSKWDDR